ncbi:MAG: hypothetical protein Q7S40_19700 [Opitutaceae bacterium]|nr:hypothetical protein [Opitutaceae bacterium]
MIDYHIDTARSIVITRAVGRVTISDLTGHFVRLMRDPAFKPELNALIIATDESAVPTPVGVGALSPLVRAWSKRRTGVKWAFVLPNQATRDFAESALQQVRLTEVFARCFLSEGAALAWLEPAPAAATPAPKTARPHAVA